MAWHSRDLTVYALVVIVLAVWRVVLCGVLLSSGDSETLCRGQRTS